MDCGDGGVGSGGLRHPTRRSDSVQGAPWNRRRAPEHRPVLHSRRMRHLLRTSGSSGARLREGSRDHSRSESDHRSPIDDASVAGVEGADRRLQFFHTRVVPDAVRKKSGEQDSRSDLPIGLELARSMSTSISQASRSRRDHRLGMLLTDRERPVGTRSKVRVRNRLRSISCHDLGRS